MTAGWAGRIPLGGGQGGFGDGRFMVFVVVPASILVVSRLSRGGLDCDSFASWWGLGGIAVLC